MKKHFFETKRIKLIARVMLVIILIVSVNMLNACNYVRLEDISLTSHKEFVEFVEKFNSKTDKDISSFISFDLDKNNNITNKSYSIHLELISPNYIKDDIFDKYTELAIVKMFFYFNDTQSGVIKNEYEVICVYCANDLNLRQNDSYKLMRSGGEQRDSLYIQLHSDNLDHYLYTYKYAVSTGGEEVMNIYISSILESTQEKLDEICQLLLDNIVIINTEG